MVTTKSIKDHLKSRGVEIHRDMVYPSESIDGSVRTAFTRIFDNLEDFDELGLKNFSLYQLSEVEFPLNPLYKYKIIFSSW